MRGYLFVGIVLSLGCGTCGAHAGAGTQVYQREGEMLIVCDNGGFVAMLSTTMLEGNLSESSAETATATRGEDGELAFELAYDAQQDAVVTPQLGGSTWTLMDLDEVSLGHANVLCNDLTTRSWWN